MDNKMKVIKKEIEGRVVTVEINEKMIDFDWESLKCPNNDISFVCITDGEFGCELTTEGDINIISNKDSETFSNIGCEDSKELMEDINSGDIYDSEKYTVLSNNWFSLSLLKKAIGDDYYIKIDEIMFEERPQTNEELVDLVIEEYVKLRNKYLREEVLKTLNKIIDKVSQDKVSVLENISNYLVENEENIPGEIIEKILNMLEITESEYANNQLLYLMLYRIVKRENLNLSNFSQVNNVKYEKLLDFLSQTSCFQLSIKMNVVLEQGFSSDILKPLKDRLENIAESNNAIIKSSITNYKVNAININGDVSSKTILNI